MGFLDKLGKTIDVWLGEEEEYEEFEQKTAREINKEKGDMFEQYVVDLFGRQKKYFAIHDWTRDVDCKQAGTYVESNQNPDLIIRYKPKDEKFAVECKWRKGLYHNKKFNEPMLGWASPEKIKRYNKYSKDNKIPVFIFIGLGGTPDDPNTTFCIPLKEAKYPDLFPSVLEKYERQTPDKSFFWKNGVLK